MTDYGHQRSFSVPPLKKSKVSPSPPISTPPGIMFGKQSTSAAAALTFGKKPTTDMLENLTEESKDQIRPESSPPKIKLQNRLVRVKKDTSESKSA